MSFPPQFLDELRARVPLSALAGRKMKLTRAGKEWKSPCPFHKEKTPSFYINDQKSFFHCFGCGAHGDAVGFLMRHDNLSFLDAVEALAAEAGMEVPKPTLVERQRYEAQKTQHEVLEAVTLWFEEELRKPAGRKALDYLRGRGLDDETIANFRLGYAPADGQALGKAMAAKGAKEAELIELGLLRRSEDNTRVYSFFRDRVIFPVSDRRGRPVAFGARLLEGEGPKYINSPEHALFHKGEILYGLPRARQAAGDGKPLIIAEGYMDVIALNRAGFTGAVAPMGTAITEAQIEALWKLTPAGLRAPILCLDGDSAGQRAAERAVERVLPLLKPDHTLKIAFMPAGEDPDSLLRQRGPFAIGEILEAAIPLSEMVWRSTLAGKPGRTPEEQAGFKAELLARVDRIADESVRHHYRTHMFEKLRGLQPVWKPGGKPSRDKALAGGPMPARRPAPVDASRSRSLLSVMARQPQLFEEFCEEFTHLAVPRGLAGLHDRMCAWLSAGHSSDSPALQQQLQDSGLADALGEVLGRTATIHVPASRLEDPDHVRRWWMHVFRRIEIAVIEDEITQTGVELAETLELPAFDRLIALRDRREELLRLDEDD